MHMGEYCSYGLCLLPVKMFLNASSTFVESKAEVSINESVFFSEVDRDKNTGSELTFTFTFRALNQCFYGVHWSE